MFMLFSGMDWN